MRVVLLQSPNHQSGLATRWRPTILGFRSCTCVRWGPLGKRPSPPAWACLADEWPSGDLVPVNAYRLGWKPKWDEEQFLASIDDEVQAVLELDTVKATIFDLLTSADK